MLNVPLLRDDTMMDFRMMMLTREQPEVERKYGQQDCTYSFHVAIIASIFYYS